MASLPLVSHRELDLHLVKADAQGHYYARGLSRINSDHFYSPARIGYVRTFITLPSTIYGVGQGPVYDAGLANKHSIQIPSLIRAALDRGVAGVSREYGV